MTEAAFVIPDYIELMRAVLACAGANLDLALLRLLYGQRKPNAPQPQPGSRDASAVELLPNLLDLGAGRPDEMDAKGVDMHLLSIALPGPQMFPPGEATALVRVANDRLRGAIDADHGRRDLFAVTSLQLPELSNRTQLYRGSDERPK